MTRTGRRADHADLASLVDSGWRDERLAEHYGVSARTIMRWRKAEGLASVPLPHPDWPHGSTRRYQLGCRCEECRAANRVAARRGRAERRVRGLPEGDPRHGTTGAAGNWGCLCAPCRAAVRERNAAYQCAHAPEPTMPRWTAQQIESVRNLSVKEAIAATGRTASAIYSLRHRLKQEHRESR